MVTQTQASQPATVVVAVPHDPIWRLSIEQYHQMIQTGILSDDDPVELLEGWLVIKMPKNPPHRLATQLTNSMLLHWLPAEWHLQTQEPITLLHSEPEPDLAVIRGQPRDYQDHHPRPDDIIVVIEVADTTLQRDREIKQQIYAHARIPTYWIINLVDRQIEVYTDPTATTDPPTYQQRSIYRADESLPIVFHGQQLGAVSVSELLP